ncbi:hypothetical protein GOC76_29385 [Sinorhizobium medicae]|nr:hypothetical protein [Sinorhizobium medicae]
MVQAVLLESQKDVGDSRRMSVQKFGPAKAVDIPTRSNGAVEGPAFTQ